MRNLLICCLLVAALPGLAQNLGRLPGAVYPGDRGPRTLVTLQSVDSVSRPAYDWYFDGTWVLNGDFVFKAGDTVHMLPGANFILHTNSILDFANAEFIAPRQPCFYGTGTVINIKYPVLRPEWYGSGNEFGLPLGYLDPPYAFTNIYQSFNYTNKLGNTNLLEHLRYIDLHIDDHTRMDYAGAASVTNMHTALTNALVTDNASLHSDITNLLNSVIRCDLMASTLSTQTIAGATSSTITNWAPRLATGGTLSTNTGIFTVTQAGYYQVLTSGYGLLGGSGTVNPQRFSIYTNGGMATYKYISSTNAVLTTSAPVGYDLNFTGYLTNADTISVGWLIGTGGFTNFSTRISISHTKGGSFETGTHVSN